MIAVRVDPRYPPNDHYWFSAGNSSMKGNCLYVIGSGDCEIATVIASNADEAYERAKLVCDALNAYKGEL